MDTREKEGEERREKGRVKGREDGKGESTSQEEKLLGASFHLTVSL